MTEKRHIPTPFMRQLKLFRRSVMPVIVWCAAVAVVVVVAGRDRVFYINATGIAEVREVAIAPLVDGVIQAMNVDLFDSVESGTVVALMDDKIVRAQIETAEAELAQLRSEVSADKERIAVETNDRDLDELNRRRRFILNEETARLDYLDRVVQQETDKVSLERLAIMLARQKTLANEKIVDSSTYDQIRLRYKEIETKINENKAALALAHQQIDDAVARKEAEQTKVFNAESADKLLQPVVERVRIQEARIREIAEHRKLLTLKAPVAGKITQVFHRTGETVLSGEPMLSMAPSESHRVLAYVDERDAHHINVGTQVEVRSLNNPSVVVTTKVAKVGSTIEEFPARLRRNAMLTQWGLPILAGDIPAGIFYPGESLQLKFVRQ